MVQIARSALERIRREARLSADGLETGGILLGRDAEAGSVPKVLRAAGPGPRAVRRRTFFKRDLDYSTEMAEQAFEDLGAVWVGDWHTHPGRFVAPSTTDVRTYVDFLTDAELGFTVFLTVVVTEGPGGWGDVILTPWFVSVEEASQQVKVAPAALELQRIHLSP